MAQQTSTSPNPASSQLLVLGSLLQLEKEARHADSLTALGFIMVNDSHRLVPYDQALLWTFNPTGGVKIQSASSVSSIDHNAPFIRWMGDLARSLNQQPEVNRIQPVNPEVLAQTVRAHWQQHAPGHALWCPLVHPRYGLSGGLVLWRRQAFREAEATLLERLLDAYAHAWGSLQGKRRSAGRTGRLRRILPGLLLVALLGSLFIPVHESVLAPAEVVAADPRVVSPPIDGVVAEIQVKPNQAVNAGDTLFSLDSTTEKNRYLIAQETLAVAQAELLSAEQKAFSDPQSKSELSLLRAKVKEREAEVRYLEALLERMQVRAEQAGIAVYTDPNDWLGKPVKVGEKVMSLAEPTRTEVQLWVPVANAINLESGARTLLFLNTDPTHPHPAQLYQAAYEAEPTPDGSLAFRAKARFDADATRLRIGLKGTGKIYGAQVPLYYYLFRRPWASLRQWLGA